MVAGEVFTPIQILGILIVLGSISTAILTRAPAPPEVNESLAKERTP
jgi:drug/metabolite transporter (DMT)-like permease